MQRATCLRASVGPASQVLQEMIQGHYEYSTSLLVWQKPESVSSQGPRCIAV